MAGDGHAANLEGGCGDAAPEGQIIANHLDPGEHFLEVAGDGDLLHRVGQLASFDPNSNCPSGVIAGDEVHAGADQPGDVRQRIY